MVSSGTYDFSAANADIVLMAFDRLRIMPSAVTQEHMWTARNELNLLLAEWSNKQVNLWKVELYTEPLLDGVPSYAVLPRTVMILDAYVQTGSGTSAIDRVISPISRTDYAALPNKLIQGYPTSFWFDRLINPTINLWPVPDGGGPYVLKYYACIQVQDADMGMAQTPDVPYLWLDAMVAGLAHRLSRKYAPDIEVLRKSDAMEAWTIAATQNVENTPLAIAPGVRAYYPR